MNSAPLTPQGFGGLSPLNIPMDLAVNPFGMPAGISPGTASGPSYASPASVPAGSPGYPPGHPGHPGHPPPQRMTSGPPVHSPGAMPNSSLGPQVLVQTTVGRRNSAPAAAPGPEFQYVGGPRTPGASPGADGALTPGMRGTSQPNPGAHPAGPSQQDDAAAVQAADARARAGPQAASHARREDKQKSTVLYCPHDGTLMQAKVVREIWNKVTWWHYQTDCSYCGERITSKDARYVCSKCKYCVCMACSSKMLGRRNRGPLPPTAGLRPEQEARPDKVSAGDILLVGPDKWGIHHVVLSRGRMRPDPMGGEWIKKALLEDGGKIPPDMENMDWFALETIESTRSLKGKEIVWYPARKFFCRNRTTGEALFVADIAFEGDCLELAYEPIPVKLMLHPLRSGHGGPSFVPEAFKEALELSAEASKHWSIKTALKSIYAKRERLDADDYPDRASRLALLQDLRKRWEQRPICCSVPIIIWQRYFDLAAGPGPEAADKAVQDIIRWIPLLSDKTMPSGLIKELSKCGWVMRGNLDV